MNLLTFYDCTYREGLMWSSYMSCRETFMTSKSEIQKRRKDIELINDNDDAIARLIADMRAAAREDRELGIGI